MIQHIKNLKYYLISFCILLIFVSCDKETLYLEWHILGNISLNEKINLEFKSNNSFIQNYTVIVSNTSKIKINNNAFLYGVTHNSNFCVTVNAKKDSNIMEIYIYPRRKIDEDNDTYIVEKNEECMYYFIENYDINLERNYYIISKDNIITKHQEIYSNINEDMFDSFSSDFAYYNSNQHLRLIF